MLSSSISSKGQVTIPVSVRQRLGLREGDRVEFVLEGEKTVLRPVRSLENPFTKFVGALPAFANIAEVNAWVDDIRRDDDGE